MSDGGQALSDGWELTGTPPDAAPTPAELGSELRWRAAPVPGTVASVVGPDGDLDGTDWWYRLRFAGPAAPAWLAFDGLATVAEAYLNGVEILRAESMWQAHEVEVTRHLRSDNELFIVCRALTPRLAVRRRPRARWRTRVVAEGELRWHRTMMLGRSPGFAPAPAAVGPWRGVRLLTAADSPLSSLTVRAELKGSGGVVAVAATTRGPSAGPLRARLGAAETELTECDGVLVGELHLDEPEPWWPHTHGRPHRHTLTVANEDSVLACRPVGFRTLSAPSDVRRDSLALKINGVEIFARGAVWTPYDLTGMAPTEAELRTVLTRVRDGGLNMLRVVGTGAYESAAFYALCDELGILVWQDLMFANLDYPLDEAAFRAGAEREVDEVIAMLTGHPSVAVLCGNSEVEQQPAMLGLDPALGRHEFFDDWVPERARTLGLDAAYVPSTPCGGAMPFHAEAGVAHYFGVSGYFGAVSDARSAGVRFAAECLAFANVPEEITAPVHDPRWKAGVIRDAGTGWGLGAGWDFDDVRDHYLRSLFDVDPLALRRYDHGRYVELSRLVTGEVMAEVLGGWRRADSACRGALVLWLKDLRPGAGFGVLDSRAHPKVAWHHLCRALAPQAVWLTDERVNGVAVHVANDRATPLRADLRLSLYRGGQTLVAEVTEALTLPAHSQLERNVEGSLGYYLDASWAYRFGPPNADLIHASLSDPAQPEAPLSAAWLFPAGRPLSRERADALFDVARLESDAAGSVLTLRPARVVYGLRLTGAAPAAGEDALTLEPGRERTLRLPPGVDRVELGAVNLEGTLLVSL